MSILNELESIIKDIETNENIIVFHGTMNKKIDTIKRDGLKSTIKSSTWYMLSTDFHSALYHATPEENDKTIPVIEFEIPLENKRWHGYPYLWRPFVRDETSSWFALKEVIPPKFIKKIHNIPYETWRKQKDKGF